METIILAGGLGTRLREAVPDLPKPMAPVAGRPFLALLLDRLAASGVSHVVLSVGYLHEKISAVFGASYTGMRISYSIEDQPLGTGGAMKQAMSHCRDDCVIAMNGDSYCEIDPASLLSLVQDRPFAMALVPVDDTSRYGRVVAEGGCVTGFQEKGISGSGFINAGVYGLSRNVFEGRGFAQKFSFEADFMMPFIAELRPEYLVADGLFIDIGIPEDYARAQILFARA